MGDNTPANFFAHSTPAFLGGYDPEQIGTLEFFEFAPNSADMVWKWREMAKAEAELTGSLVVRFAVDCELPYDPQAEFRHIFLQFVIDYVRSVKGDVGWNRSTKRWIKHMIKIGFTQKFAKRVMKVNYQDYRGNKTCAEYMVQIMEKKFRYLTRQEENYMAVGGSFALNANYLDVGNIVDSPYETSAEWEGVLWRCVELQN